MSSVDVEWRRTLMVRNIVVVLVLCVLVYFGFRWYQQHRETTSATSGEFTCQGCDSPEEHARFLKENSGETTDGDSERKTTSARTAAVDAESGQASSNGVAGAQSSAGAPALPPTAATGQSSMQAPVPTGYPTSSAAVVVPTTVQPGATPAGTAPQLEAGLPTTDTQSANAPNGARFTGSGSYLVYRQGNITYRLDTSTGRSCVIYATMEEWRKQIVLSHGCGRTA